jgi:diphthamide synthase (EF-2-diphthine--ammonia ligase)
MIASGTVAHLVSVDLKKLPRRFAGRAFDRALLDDLPNGTDLCGENGEFHTFVSAGQMLAKPIAVKPGEIVERDGGAYADLLPA